MAKRRTPPRYKSGPKKGQFMSKRARAARKGGRKRKGRRNPGRTVAKRTTKRNPTRKRAAARRRTTRKRTYRRNPRRVDIVQTLTNGVVEAGQILIGKAAVRSIPDLARLPKQGNTGLAVQIGTALAIGYGAEMFLSPAASRAMMAGALSAPLETLIVSYRVPWLSTALSPVTAEAGVSAYVMGSPSASLGRYARRPRIAPPAEDRGLGRYATERGMDYAYH